MLSHDIPIRPAARAAQARSDILTADPLLAPLALIKQEVIRATEDKGWESNTPQFDAEHLAAGIPLLHQGRLTMDRKRFVRLMQRLVEIVERSGVDGATSLHRPLSARNFDWSPFIRAAIQQYDEAFELLTAESALAATLMQAATTPLLLAIGRKVCGLLANTPWDRGYCPVCAAWPLLAEIRGLEQQRWLRCGRCASSWRVPLQRCIYCGNQDFESLGYLAAEDNSESRRAVTCERCRGYLKSVTAFSNLTFAEMVRLDLSTVALDIAAVLQDYERPAGSGYALRVEVALR